MSRTESTELNMLQTEESMVLTAGYSSHHRPFRMTQREGLHSYLFRIQTEGRAEALIDGTLRFVLPGELLWYRPGDPYELIIGDSREKQEDEGLPSATALSVDYYLFCKGKWLDEWWIQTHRPRRCAIPIDEGILTIWQQIIMEQRLATPSKEAIGNHLLKALCMMLDRAVSDAERHGADSANFLAQKMRRYVLEHASATFTIRDVAEHVGLSVSRTVHLFKETFGQTIMEFAQEVRLKVACERIQFSTMTIEQAAESAGFYSYSYFHRLFKARFGCSPKEFRKRSAGMSHVV